MRPRALATVLILAVFLCVPQLAKATGVHAFNCQDCHKPGVTIQSFDPNNVCLQCHSNPDKATTFTDGTVHTSPAGFALGDASNALGSYPAGYAPGDQTSHFWAAQSDMNTSAGAQAPSRTQYPQFYSRYGTSTGRITCSRCHNPHGDAATNPMLLRLGAGSSDQMCLACHTSFNQSSNHGLGTHPMVASYANALAGNTSSGLLSTPVEQGANGLVGLVNGGVSCTSCHAPHFADSNGATADGPGTANVGDGYMLKDNGPTVEEADPGKKSICQDCHNFKMHGNSTLTHSIGCLVCHGGHNHDPNGNPNYDLLRKTVKSVYMPKTGAVGTATLNYTSADANGNPNGDWLNSSGTGLCQGCHNPTLPHNGYTQGGAAQCTACHTHNNSNGSFIVTCNECHGYPPSTNTAGGPTGYADDTTNGHNYANSTAFKDESKTPHLTHAGGGSNYSFNCDVCHLTRTHDSGTFQDVFNSPSDTFTSANGAVTPSYNTSGSGTCSSTYCHSNGGPRDINGTRTYSTQAVTWAGGKGTIVGTANECSSCHGNSATTMQTNSDSPTHVAHLNKGFTCNVCHVQTAASDTALAAGAVGGTHVNGTVDVSFDTSYNLGQANLTTGTTPYDATNGTCSVYCHSDGKGTYSTPKWADATTGACGTCHGDPPATGSHAIHTSATGANISCDTCHGSGASTGTQATHVNGKVDVVAGICDTCHAVDATDGGTTPIWGDPTSVQCKTCHAGSATTSYVDASGSTRTAPAMSAYYTAGHGKTTVTAGTAPNLDCTACHDTADTALHMDGIAGNTNRLKAVSGVTFSASNPAPFCQACHSGMNVHFTGANGSSAGDQCTICHDQHGEGSNDAMIRTSIASSISGTGANSISFPNKTLRSSYANSSFTGICQVCHAATDTNVSFFNAQTDSSSSHMTPSSQTISATGLCTDCHKHTTSPAFKVDCTTCHNNGTQDGQLINAAPATGLHAFHLSNTTMTGAFVTNNGLCVNCHGTGADNGQQAGHMNGSASFGNKMISYNATTKTCVNQCHSTDAGVNGEAATIWDSTGQIQCDDCHRAPDANATAAGVTSYIGPTVVWPGGGASGKRTAYGSHLSKVLNETDLGTSTNWNTQCQLCHPQGHTATGTGAVTVPLPPTSWNNRDNGSGTTMNMQTQLGIDYTLTGGIYLGGTGADSTISTATTEADVCWDCHKAVGIGELEDNALISNAANMTSGNGSYHFGQLSTAKTGGSAVEDWTTAGAWRQDAYDSRLTRPIASVHTVNLSGTAGADISSVAANVNSSGQVARGSLNSSLPGYAASQGSTTTPTLENKQYIRCSYCHDVHDLNKAVGDSTSNEPFLRGTWLSDPYPADVPPTKNQTWTSSNHYYNSNQRDGMPRIKTTCTDQGGFFIDQNSSNPTSGKTVAQTAGLCTLCHGTDINNMDYYTGSDLWQGSNGHSNAALGGTGTHKVNLFDATRGQSRYFMGMQDYINRQVNSNTPAWGRNYLQKTYAARNDGWYDNGAAVGTSTRQDGDYSNWYSSTGIGSHTGVAGGKAHDFTCSKCHSPHATGLPALLTTNCLDVNISQWTNAYNSNVNYNTNQSTNCHRKTSTSTGWNKLAPAQ